jgi:long-chain acyl-CoA synthetase
MSHLLDERFRRVCHDRRWSTAIHDLTDGRRRTFGDLLEQYLEIKRQLGALGIEPGSAVVALVGNRPTFFPLLAACMAARTTFIPLGETTDEEAAAVIVESGARAVVTDRALPFESTDEAAVGDGMRLVVRPAPSGRASYGESVVLKLTSGSTAVPKAAIAAIEHLINDGDHVIEAMALRPDDVNFSCIPLSHSYALGNVVLPLLLQGTAVALRQSFNPAQSLGDMAAAEATVLPGVPFMFDRFRTLDVERMPPKLRLLITAGARIDPETVRWFWGSLARKVHSFYGSSETGGIAYDDTEDLTEPLHVGRPMPETEVTIRDADPSGGGRVFVTGSAVARSYAEVGAGSLDSGFIDGGFLTGDLGRFDGERRLVLTGRVSTLVNVAGLKVDPAEVERVLIEVPGIAAVRVLGASCDRRGQQLVAFVVSDRPMTSLDLRRRCARMLSPHKIPRQFIFLDRLPVDARGKMDRRALEALAAETPV